MVSLEVDNYLFMAINVVNVPADVNSVVNNLPKPINESQTIPIIIIVKQAKLEVPLSVSQC